VALGPDARPHHQEEVSAIPARTLGLARFGCGGVGVGGRIGDRNQTLGTTPRRTATSARGSPFRKSTTAANGPVACARQGVETRDQRLREKRGGATGLVTISEEHDPSPTPDDRGCGAPSPSATPTSGRCQSTPLHDPAGALLLAILFTFALGTAAGDLVADQLELDYSKAALMFGAIIGLVVLAWETPASTPSWRSGLAASAASWPSSRLTTP
jgi:hypothetical protein